MPASRPLLRIAVLNDYPIVVAGLAHVLARHDSRIRVIEVDSQAPVLSDVDIVLCDTFASTAGVGPGLADLVGRTDAKLVLFSGDLGAPTVEAAMQAGVAAYISKRLSPGELISALEAVHRGERVTPPVGDDAEVAGVGDWPGREAQLSSREAEILAYIASGHSNAEIAGALFLSINSIKTYVRSAYRKIGVQRRTQAVLWAMENGFVSDSKRRLTDPPGTPYDGPGC